MARNGSSNEKKKKTPNKKSNEINKYLKCFEFRMVYINNFSSLYISFLCLRLWVLILKVHLTRNKNEYELNFHAYTIYICFMNRMWVFFRIFYTSKRINFVFGIFTKNVLLQMKLSTIRFLSTFSDLKFSFSGLFCIYTAITPVTGCDPRLFRTLFWASLFQFHYSARQRGASNVKRVQITDEVDLIIKKKSWWFFYLFIYFRNFCSFYLFLFFVSASNKSRIIQFSRFGVSATYTILEREYRFRMRLK